MGFGDDHMQKLLELEESRISHIPSVCACCGSQKGVRSFADDNGSWAEDRPVYSKAYRRLLCFRCMSCISPFHMQMFEKDNKAELRKLPIKDNHGNLLPYIKKAQMAARPEFYPFYYLGEKEIKADLIGIHRCIDCVLLSLIPDQGQEYFMDRHLQMFGCVYTAVNFAYVLPQRNLPYRVKFTNYYERNSLKTVLWQRR